MSDALAVVVGIDHYPDQMLGPLQGAVNDAEEFCAWLKTPAAGALTEDPDLGQTEIHKIISDSLAASPLSARPMVSDVETALDFVKVKAEQRLTEWEQGGAEPYRRLYLFFAGHGIGPDVEQAALLMANAGNGRFGYYLQGRPFANYFRARACFDEILLFMDCCRDAYPFVAPPPLRWDPPQSSGRAVNHCYGFATKWSKKAREATLSGKPHGYFSTALLEGLKGSAADTAGIVRADALESYVVARIPKLVEMANALGPGKKREVQSPDFTYPNRTPMVIADHGAAAALALLTRVTVALSAAEQGAPLEILDAGLDVVPPLDETRPGADTWTFRLPFGVYQLGNPATGRKLEFEVVGPEDVPVSF